MSVDVDIVAARRVQSATNALRLVLQHDAYSDYRRTYHFL